jgi:ribonuclease HI
MPEQPIVTIYTDGSCEPNPGPGGWAAILITGGQHEIQLSGGEAHTTNNRMELTAAIEALKAIANPSSIRLYTDSQYLQKGITEWLPNWIKRNWRSTSGQVANQDLWKALVELKEKHTIQWQWTRAHVGTRYNEEADKLARQAMRKYKK